jgi:hypothetical protein
MSDYEAPEIDWRGSPADAAKLIHDRDNPADRVWLRRQDADLHQQRRHFGTITKDNSDEAEAISKACVFLQEVREELYVLESISEANAEIQHRKDQEEAEAARDEQRSVQKSGDAASGKTNDEFRAMVRERTYDLADKFMAKVSKEAGAARRKHGYKGHEAELRDQATFNVNLLLKICRNTVLIEDLSERIARIERKPTDST